MSEGERKAPPLGPAQQRLVLSVERLIHKLVHDLAPWAAGKLRQELASGGRYGATLAAARFDPEHGTRFTSYAVPYIAGEIRRARDGEPRRSALMRRASAAGQAYLAEAPDSFELAWDEPEVNRARAHDVTRQLFAAMLAGVAAPGPDPEEAAMGAELSQVVAEALGAMDEGKRRLLTLRYIDDVPAKAAAEVLGMSERTARRHHEAALEELGEALRRRGLGEDR